MNRKSFFRCLAAVIASPAILVRALEPKQLPRVSWGKNTFGQLGLVRNRPAIREIVSPEDIRIVDGHIVLPRTLDELLNQK